MSGVMGRPTLTKDEGLRAVALVQAVAETVEAQTFAPVASPLDLWAAVEDWGGWLLDGHEVGAGCPLGGFGVEDAALWSVVSACGWAPAVCANVYRSSAEGAEVEHWTVWPGGRVVTVGDVRRVRGVETLDEHDARMVAEAEANRKRNREAASKAVRWSDKDREIRRRLSKDPDARQAMAVHLRAKVRDGIARGMVCPSCGRPDVWFAIEKGWAKCNHRGSCGWSGSVFDLAAASGTKVAHE